MPLRGQFEPDSLYACRLDVCICLAELIIPRLLIGPLLSLPQYGPVGCAAKDLMEHLP